MSSNPSTPVPTTPAAAADRPGLGITHSVVLGRHNATSMRNLFDPTRLAFEGDSPIAKTSNGTGVEADLMSPATRKASERWVWLTTFQRNLTCKYPTYPETTLCNYAV